MKNSEVCEGAAELIDEYGWVRGKFGDYHVGFCLFGAMFQVTPSGHYQLPNVLLGPVMPGITDPQCVDVVDHNDYVLEDGRQAVDLLMDAAKYWRDQGK